MVATNNNATPTSSTTSTSFPPCTADACTVEEEHKQQLLAATRAAVDKESKESCEVTERCVSACAAYGRVCPCAARIAAHSACDAVKKMRKESNLFDDTAGCGGPNSEKSDFCFLNSDDVVIGRKLGEGGFSNVNSCVVTTGDEAGQEFAIKYLKRKCMVDLHAFKHGAADLAIEAHFLNRLSHDNIVKLHGFTAGSVETNVASGKECGFFIVIDRLFDTLEDRIEQRHAQHEKQSRLTRWTHDYKEKQRQELLENVRTAYSIADAMEYLHSLGLVYRDLKPDNIGFDKNGVLKLFDFGLARELKDKDKRGNAKYKLTGNTGSRRYMAPEVALDEPYDQSVDVYSFGILLWELCAAEKPFHGYSSGKHMDLVVLGGERPPMDQHHTHHWPMNLQWLITRCFAAASADRPTFGVVKQVLRDVLACKEDIPKDLTVSSPAAVESATPQTPPPPQSSNGLGSLFRSPKSNRKKIAEPESFKGMKPPTGSGGRSKTWGFGSRR